VPFAALEAFFADGLATFGFATTFLVAFGLAGIEPFPLMCVGGPPQNADPTKTLDGPSNHTPSVYPESARG